MNSTFNFDTCVKRGEQNSKKWLDWQSFGIDEIDPEILPMWIADMEFSCEPRILEELKKPINWSVIGYDRIPKDFFDVFVEWEKRRNNWDIKADWLVPVSGVVNGIALAIQSFSNIDEGVVIQPPVYPPFFTVTNENHRTLLENNLINTDDGYRIDFDDLDRQLSKAKVMVLCNPHNPIGRVWKKDELERIADLCIKHDILLVSDEIHSDLIFSNQKHIPIASLSEEIRERTITLNAPSKTFNVAGLMQSVAIIPNEKLRETFSQHLKALGYMHMNSFSGLGFVASYRYGEAWLDAVLPYIEANAEYARDFIQKHLPQIKVHKNEATFLMWLDMRAIAEDKETISNALINEGKILLGDGLPFGKAGDRFYRLNIGCPRTMLEDGLQRIKRAIDSLN